LRAEAGAFAVGAARRFVAAAFRAEPLVPEDAGTFAPAFATRLRTAPARADGVAAFFADAGAALRFDAVAPLPPVARRGAVGAGSFAVGVLRGVRALTSRRVAVDVRPAF